ncbi:MAG TPA: nickel-dependent hydrogenase large subunit [Candidatus Anoxymicrobiaceae bacterium]
MDEINVTGDDLTGQKVRIYPVTRIQGRADIEVLFDPHHNVAEARFRALDYRGTDRMAVGMPALRVPQVLSTACGVCGPFHKLASCMAVESACGTQVPAAAGSLRELICWLLLASSHLATITYCALPDFALPTSDAAVKNVKGIYMVDQEFVSRLSHAMTSIYDALDIIAGNRFRVPVLLPGGVSRLPAASEIEAAGALLSSCEDELRETVRLAEMLTRRESRMMETGTPLPGSYMCSVTDGLASLIGTEVAAATFAGGEPAAMSFDEFLSSVQEDENDWTFVKPLTVKGLDCQLVGPLARVNMGFGDDTPLVVMERARLLEQWEHPLDSEFFFLMTLALEAVWAWEKAKKLLSSASPDGECWTRLAPAEGGGHAVIDSPRGLLVHQVELDAGGAVTDYRVYSPLQFNYRTINEHLTSVAARTVGGIDIGESAAARLQLAVRSFNPCVPCGTH